MRRYAPLIVVGVGVVMLVLGFANIVPQITSAGGMLVFFGLVWFGLSFIPQPEAVSDERPMPVMESLTKIFYSPAEVFRNLRRHPQWFAPLLIVTIVSGFYLAAFTQRVGPQKISDFIVEKTEQSGFQIPPDQIAKMRKDQLEQLTDPVYKVANAISGFAGSFAGFAFLAAIYLLIVLAMGGSINFWQAFSAVVYAIFPVAVIRYLLSGVILFIKDPAEIHPVIGQQTLVTDNLGVLVNPADSAILWVVLSAFGVLSFYGLWLMATGLKNAGERVSASAAWMAAVVVWVLGLALLSVWVALFPGFVS